MPTLPTVLPFSATLEEIEQKRTETILKNLGLSSLSDLVLVRNVSFYDLIGEKHNRHVHFIIRIYFLYLTLYAPTKQLFAPYSSEPSNDTSFYFFIFKHFPFTQIKNTMILNRTGASRYHVISC